MSYSSAGPGSIAQTLVPCGIRFLRLYVTNTGGAGATASAWAVLT